VDYTNPKISKVAGKVGFAVAPKGPAGKHIQWFYDEGLGINNYSSLQEKEAAWLFIQWRSSLESQFKEIHLKEARRFDLCSRKVLESQEYVEAAREVGAEEYAKSIRDTLKVATPMYFPSIPEFVEVAEALSSRVSAAIAGVYTVEKALEDANSEIYRILEEAGYY